MNGAQNRVQAPTPEQARAADPSASAWVSANAGSGKTHVLVERVLRLLLAGVDPSRILCLTFTRAAASEMANRVFGRLAAWSAADDAELRDSLTLLEDTHISEERLAFARTLFARALETPGGLKIQTIHAFCERVLHQFSFEANVTAHFEVMDTALSGELRARAVASTLADSSGDTVMAAALDQIAALTGELRFGALIDAVIAVRQQLTAWIDRHGGIDSALVQLRQRLLVNESDNADAIAGDWLASPHLPRSQWGDAAAALLASTASTDRKRGTALQLCLNCNDDEMAVAAYKAFLLTDKGTPYARIGTKGFAAAHPALADAIERELARAAELVERERAVAIHAATAALLRLGYSVIQHLEALKLNSGLLDYDDLIQRTLILLSQQDATPWVLYKLDGGIDHILVDEAQDTNPAQWQIVQRLAEEFFSGESARGSIRTVFAVGDEKQSIYSFQGAAPAEFDRMRRFFAGRVGQAQLAFASIGLTVSFRSAPIVLQAVDEVFRLEIARQGLGAADDAIVHTALRDADPGVVELWPLERPRPAEDREAWDAPLDRPNPDHPRFRLARNVALEVKRLVSGEAIIDRGVPRAILPGDVLVLVRRRNDLVDALIAALRRSGIAVAGADRLILGEHLAVQDLMAAGDAALLPQDDLTLATVLKSPLISLREDELFALAWQRPASLWQVLRARGHEPPFERAYERVAGWMARADTLRPFEFFSAILTEDGGRLALLERLGPEAADAVDEFLTLALTYEEMEPASLQGFLHWMRGQSIDIKRNMEDGHGAVRIMTVHGAKGLEAPVVFLADTCEVPTRRLISPLLPLDDMRGTTDGLVWRVGKAETLPEYVGDALDRAMIEQMAEYRRLLYVAMTRARDRLYVCGALGGNAGKPHEQSWYALVEMALAHQMQPLDETEEPRLRFGTPPAPLRAPAVEEATTGLSLPGWLVMPAPAEHHTEIQITPSALDLPGDGQETHVEGSDGDGQAAERARERGNYVHRLLELLPDLPAAERMQAAERLGGIALPHIETQIRAAWAAEALALLEHGDLAPLFSSQGVSEVAIAGRIGHDPVTGAPITISGQIDRLVVQGTEVILADYKTNRLPPARPEDAPPAYLAQLAAYREALKPQFPGKALRFFLIWTANGNVMEIRADLLDSAWNARFGHHTSA